MTTDKEVPTVLMYMGKPIEDLTREELLEALRQTHRDLQAAQEHWKNSNEILGSVIEGRRHS
jgi:hypothetical protein